MKPLRLLSPLLLALGLAACNGYAPCDDKACGEVCTVCPPGDPDCVEVPGRKACDTRGECIGAVPVLCPE